MTVLEERSESAEKLGPHNQLLQFICPWQIRALRGGGGGAIPQTLLVYSSCGNDAVKNLTPALLGE